LEAFRGHSEFPESHPNTSGRYSEFYEQGLEGFWGISGFWELKIEDFEGYSLNLKILCKI